MARRRRASIGADEPTPEGAPEAASQRPSLKPLLAMKSYVLAHPAKLALAVLALLMSALAMLSLPLAVRRMIDLGFSGSDDAFINRYFAVILMIGIVLAIASAARMYLVNWPI